MQIVQRASVSLRSRWYASRYNIGQAGYSRIYFYHVQKAGGSSIRRSFYNLAQPIEKVPDIFHSTTVRRAILGDKVYISHHVGLINQGYYFFASSHLPMNKIHLPDNSFTFTNIRHPVKRFLSRYRELLFLHEQQPDNFHLKQVEGWFSTDFMTMMKHVPDDELLFQLRMFSANLNVDEAVQNIKNLSYYILTEDMNQGMAYIAEHLDLPLEVYHNRKARHDYEPTAEEMQYLLDRLQPEIDMVEKVTQHYKSHVSKLP